MRKKQQKLQPVQNGGHAVADGIKDHFEMIRQPVNDTFKQFSNRNLRDAHLSSSFTSA
jgi:hypothetical protein